MRDKSVINGDFTVVNELKPNWNLDIRGDQQNSEAEIRSSHPIHQLSAINYFLILLTFLFKLSSVMSRTDVNINIKVIK